MTWQPLDGFILCYVLQLFLSYVSSVLQTT